MKKDKFHFDLGAELLLGLGGKAKAEWLATEPDISSGGWALGLSGSFKAVYRLNNNIAPFIGLGPQILMLHNNGKDVGTTAAQSYYNYTEGWNEFLFHLQGSLGLDLQFPAITLTPELHFGVIGFSTTDWEPNEDGATADGVPGMFGFSIKIAKKLF